MATAELRTIRFIGTELIHKYGLRHLTKIPYNISCSKGLIPDFSASYFPQLAAQLCTRTKYSKNKGFCKRAGAALG